MEITFLGTGTSHGVPRIGCMCDVCLSDDPRNKRYRSAVLIREGETSVVIDTPPEFRLQALRSGIYDLDAVFYTHNHADHVNGIDDLRVFSEMGPLEVYGPQQVLKDIKSRFSYAVGENGWNGGLPQLILKTIKPEGVTIGPLHFIPVLLIHGRREVFGYRIGNFAYLTDCKEVPASSYPLLEGVEVLVLDALRFRRHPTHLTIDEAVEVAQKIGAKVTYFTHLTHENDHAQLDAYLPKNIHPAYDGLTVTI